MGFGGGGGVARQLQQEKQSMAFQEAQLSAQQAALSTQLAERDKAAQAAVQGQFADAQGQTKAGQAAAQLGILDYIKTSPAGLQNKPKTGKLTVLGN
jgi:hypothetical protein